MRLTSPFRVINLTTRLGITLTAILVLAAVAQTLLYFKTRDETLVEADDSYQALAKALEVATTQVGPEGWKDERLLADYREKLRAKGVRDIQVTEAGRPFRDPIPPPTPAAGKKKGKTPPAPHDIVISGIVGEGKGNRLLEFPLVIEGKYYAKVRIYYSLENIRDQLAENFKKRLYALLGVFAGGLAVTLIVTRNATLPLDALANGAAQVAMGRLEVRVKVDRDDEIGRLAATFNRMTEALQKRQELEVRLAAAEKRAEIGHLASGLAHEIKNPLNALSLGLDVLRRRHRPADESAAAEYGSRIEALREEINRLTTLINNFLAFGRPLTLNMAPLDFGPLVSATLSDLAETAERARVTVDAEIAPTLPSLSGDGSLLKSAVWNLVQNAVQSMERTGGRMTVRLSEELAEGEPGRKLRLVVEDTGPGIAPADLGRIFEPYFSKKEGGLGLGLAMVRRIVEDHGGRISASNRDDGQPGAHFEVTLPAWA